jgi:hypothetical protein
VLGSWLGNDGERFDGRFQRGALGGRETGDALRQLRDRRHDWLSQRIARLTPGQMEALAGAIDALNFLADHED